MDQNLESEAKEILRLLSCSCPGIYNSNKKWPWDNLHKIDVGARLHKHLWKQQQIMPLSSSLLSKALKYTLYFIILSYSNFKFKK